MKVGQRIFFTTISGFNYIGDVIEVSPDQERFSVEIFYLTDEYAPGKPASFVFSEINDLNIIIDVTD